FQVTEGDQCDVYAYFRPARIDSSSFETHRIENQVVGFFNGISSLGDSFGKQTLASKLQEGFTVIAKDASETNVDFTLGIVPLGKKLCHPSQADSSDGKITYENERTEIHQIQRDFVGPIVVPEGKGALYLTIGVDGIQAIDLMVMRKAEAEASLLSY